MPATVPLTCCLPASAPCALAAPRQRAARHLPGGVAAQALECWTTASAWPASCLAHRRLTGRRHGAACLPLGARQLAAHRRSPPAPGMHWTTGAPPGTPPVWPLAGRRRLLGRRPPPAARAYSPRVRDLGEEEVASGIGELGRREAGRGSSQMGRLESATVGLCLEWARQNLKTVLVVVGCSLKQAQIAK